MKFFFGFLSVLAHVFRYHLQEEDKTVDNPPPRTVEIDDADGAERTADGNLFSWVGGIRLHSQGTFADLLAGETMSEYDPRYVQCPVLVVRVTEAQVMGDTVADALRDQLLALYDQTGATHAVIDMEQVAYLSSAGIRPLLALNREVREREGRLILCGLNPDVEGVFVATRLISHSHSAPATFESAPDISSAIAHLYQKA